MHYIVNGSGYISAVSFGCDISCGGSACVEYTGSVPTGYNSLEAWYAAESETLYRWKISSGKLVLDSSATPPPVDGMMHLSKVTDDEHSIPEGADFNDYTTPGVYRCATSAIAQTLVNGPAYTGAGFRLIVSAVSASKGVTHTAIYNSLNFQIYTRIQNSDEVWSGWKNAVPAGDGDYADCNYVYTPAGDKEWLNPRLTVGYEYRTTERYAGKPVYAKIINFDGLPNSTMRYKAHGIANIDDIVHVSGSAKNGSSVVFIPSATGDTYMNATPYSVGLSWAVGATETNVYMVTNADRTSWTGRILIKYTKTTD